jgi:hypothetical protein
LSEEVRRHRQVRIPEDDLRLEVRRRRPLDGGHGEHLVGGAEREPARRAVLKVYRRRATGGDDGRRRGRKHGGTTRGAVGADVEGRPCVATDARGDRHHESSPARPRRSTRHVELSNKAAKNDGAARRSPQAIQPPPITAARSS